MKKKYMMPGIDITEVLTDTVLTGGSSLDPAKGDQSVTPSEEEFNEEFGGNRHGGQWDDEEDY